MGTLSDHIRASGITQREWAVRLGVSEAYLSGLVRGSKRPSLDLAVRLERETGGAVPASAWIPDADANPAAAQQKGAA